MAKQTAIVEPITSEPEIIDSPSTQEDTAVPEPTSNIQTTTKENEDAESDSDFECDQFIRQAHRIAQHGRDFSPPPRPRGFTSRIHEVPILIDTKSLNEFIKIDDVCVNTASNQMIYIANHPFHAADLDRISWLFKLGKEGEWEKKPVVVLGEEGYTFEMPREKERRGGRAREIYYEDRFNDGYDPVGRRSTPIVRLGNALRVFKTDEKKFGTEKVKFVMAVKGKGSSGWVRLMISHSRQAAVINIFHEILNGYDIIFVGAMLQDVVVPVEKKDLQTKFTRVASLKEAQEVGKGIVGVIC
jgi:hypothetical protein